MTLAEFYRKYDREINKAIDYALAEDKVRSDVTTNLVLKGSSGNKKATAVLLCKQDCTVAGLEIFKRVYKKIDKNAFIKSYYKDGQRLRNKTKVLEVKSSLRNLLAGERTALNFLQKMSGIAVLTGEFVKKLKFKGAKILHTRKTTPNFRLFEVAAVKTGGGDFHRLNLDSSVLIKDNHIEAAGSIDNVLNILNSEKIPGRMKKKFEIEVKNLSELNYVVSKGKKIIKVVMLDNFKPSDIKKAVNMLRHTGIKIEISGGINLQNFAKFQRQHIDFYSVGMLTHSYKSVDFSLEF